MPQDNHTISTSFFVNFEDAGFDVEEAIKQLYDPMRRLHGGLVFNSCCICGLLGKGANQLGQIRWDDPLSCPYLHSLMHSRIAIYEIKTCFSDKLCSTAITLLHVYTDLY